MCKRKKNFICLMMAFILFIFGMFVKEEVVDFNSAHISTEFSDSYISALDHVIVDVQPCTLEMLGNYDNISFNKSNTNYSNQKKDIKPLMDFLNQDLEDINMVNTSHPYLKRVNLCNVYQEERIVQYEHLSDGKKEF